MPVSLGEKPHMVRETIQSLTARDNEVMRKRVLGPVPLPGDTPNSREWLNLQELAEVEVTSELTATRLNLLSISERDRAGALLAQANNGFG
jgi:hypothetical protein